nr:nlpC/P60 family protein [uncultured bacterium]
MPTFSASNTYQTRSCSLPTSVNNIAAFIAEARTWTGTPFVHHQACKGIGADCTQFVVAAARVAGLLPAGYRTVKYNRDWALHTNVSVLTAELSRYCDEIPLKGIEPGDLITFNFSQTAHHLGIYIGNGEMIHAHIRRGVCIEPVEHYRARLVAAWRLK